MKVIHTGPHPLRFAPEPALVDIDGRPLTTLSDNEKDKAMTKDNPKPLKIRNVVPTKCWLIRYRRIVKAQALHIEHQVLVRRWKESREWTRWMPIEPSYETLFRTQREAHAFRRPGDVRKLYRADFFGRVAEFEKLPDGTLWTSRGERMSYVPDDLCSTRDEAIRASVKALEAQVKRETERTSERYVRLREIKKREGIK